MSVAYAPMSGGSRTAPTFAITHLADVVSLRLESSLPFGSWERERFFNLVETRSVIVFQPGTVIADGLYTLRRQLGEGATAHVWFATQKLPDGQQRDIVLKILLPEIRLDAQKRKMFLEEARLAATLHHPSIVEVYSIDQTQDFDFLVMERIWGTELDDLIEMAKKTKAVIPWPLAVAMIRDASLGIHYANTLRDHNGTPLHLVHRDIKPGNLLLDIYGQVKVIDFGIAKTETSHLKTQTGIIKGTIAYMSPEHLRSEKLDVRSDIYALAVVLYELCTGYRPFAGENMTSVMFSILTQEPYNPQTMRSDLPDDLCALLLRNLNKNKEERSENPAVFVQELNTLLLQNNQHPNAHDLRAYLREHKPEIFDEYRQIHGQDPPEPPDENQSTQAFSASFTNAETQAVLAETPDNTARLPGAPPSTATGISIPGVLLENMDLSTLNDDVRDTIAQGDGAQLPDYVRQLAEQILAGNKPATPQELEATKPIPHHTLSTNQPASRDATDRNAPTSILSKHTLGPANTPKSSPLHSYASPPLPTSEHSISPPERNDLFSQTVSDNDIPLSFRLPSQQDFGSTQPTPARAIPPIPQSQTNSKTTLQLDGRKNHPTTPKASNLWIWMIAIFLGFGLGIGGFLALYNQPTHTVDEDQCPPRKRTTLQLLTKNARCSFVPDRSKPNESVRELTLSLSCGKHYIAYRCVQHNKKALYLGTYDVIKKSPDKETCYIDQSEQIKCPKSDSSNQTKTPSR